MDPNNSVIKRLWCTLIKYSDTIALATLILKIEYSKCPEHFSPYFFYLNFFMHLFRSPGLCPWRGYVVTQAFGNGVSVGVGVSTMFKFSNVCIFF